jgi:probable phosphoglycerate mutase
LADRSWEFVFLARHGQTEWNRVRRRQGQLDSPLTAAGIAQAHLLGLDPAEALRRRHPHDAVYAINPAEHTWRELRTR